MTKVEGLERLKKRFAKLPQKMRVEVRAAIDKSADELIAFQKRLVPVETGELRDSIEKRDGRHELSVEVFSDDFKARWVEFGTVKMTARPFFYPAYRTLRRRIKGRISRAVKKAVKGNV